MDRYLIRFGIAAFLSSFLLASTNLLIDPYGTLWGAAKAWPLERVFASFYPYLSKPTVFADADPDTVLFGNSRVAYGFDPLHAEWPSSLGDGFNYGIPSARMTNTAPYFETVLRATSPETVILGMDYFFDWRSSSTQEESPPSEVMALASGRGPWARSLARAEDILATTVSITTLRNSVKTILFQRKMAGYGINKAGYSPQLELSCATACGDRTAIEEVTRKIRTYRLGYLQPGKRAEKPAINGNIVALEQALSRAQERGIRVVVILYPYHVSLLDTIQVSGFWPDFQRWKRAIVEATSAYDGVSVLDFSVVSDYSAEPIPGPDAKTQLMQWYFDPGHFRPELGDRILQNVAGEMGQCPCDLLTVESLAAQLERQELDIQSWRRQHAGLDALILSTVTDM